TRDHSGSPPARESAQVGTTRHSQMATSRRLGRGPDSRLGSGCASTGFGRSPPASPSFTRQPDSKNQGVAIAPIRLMSSWPAPRRLRATLRFNAWAVLIRESLAFGEIGRAHV